MQPLVKWAGGKRQLLPYIKEMLPKSYGTYYEPFAGGLAVLFELKPLRAVVNDINSELMNVYKQVRDCPGETVRALKAIDRDHECSADCKAFYYLQRDLFNNLLNSNSVEQAARFVYINKHAYNGLYRVNSKGLFNVPFNNKKGGNSFDENNIFEMSMYLKDVSILCVDFEDALPGIKKGDFVFFDSPYVPLNAASFADYTSDGFAYEEHVRLAKLYRKLSDMGVYCMLTNHDTELVRELYDGFNFRIVDVKRMINSDPSNRIGREVIITNYRLGE